MTREEILQAVGVTLQYLAGRDAPADLVIEALMRYAAALCIRHLDDGKSLEEFLSTCRVAFEKEVRNAKKTVS
jgi:hypothetical protein